MGSVNDMINWFASRSPLDESRLEPEDVLPGLAPQLVIDLAGVAGASLDDLVEILQLAPYGDRAAMAAYGLIDLGQDHDGHRRPIRVKPFCLKVIAAAAEFVASVADPNVVAMHLQLAADDLAPEESYVPLTSPDQQAERDDYVVSGVVRHATVQGEGRMRVEVDLTSPHTLQTVRPRRLRMVTDIDSSIRANSRVRVAFPRLEVALPAFPVSIASTHEA
jgi:hypothetical protein